MDQLFCESIEFKLPVAVAQRCTATAATMADAFGMALAAVGLELIDYDTCVFQRMPGAAHTLVMGHSRLWRERLR